MIARVMAAEWLKIRKKPIWFLAVIGPAGVIGLQAANFGLRYDYLVKQYEDDLWGGLIGNVHYLAVPALLLGLALVASMLASLEHQTNAWKQTLALPVTRFAVFTAKFAILLVVLAVSCTLLAVGTAALGAGLGFGYAFPAGELLTASYLPFVAAMPFMALQIWMSVTLSNQAVPLTVGIAGTILSLYSVRMSDWFPWKWPYLINEWNDPLVSAGAGLAAGFLLYAAGLVHFARRDVK